MSDISESETERYMIGLLIGMLVALVSFGVGIILALGPETFSPEIAAAWAWVIGTGTGLYVVPWAKQAVPTGGESSAQ